MTLAELNAAAGIEESPYRWRATRRTQVSTPDSAQRASRQAERRAQVARHAASDEAVEQAAAKQESTEQASEEIANPVAEETTEPQDAPEVVEDHTGQLLAEHGSSMILNPFAIPETAQAVLAQVVAKKHEPARKETPEAESDDVTSRRRRRRRRGDVDLELEGGSQDDPPNTVTRVRAPRGSVESHGSVSDKVTSVRGSTRLEAKRQRRRESRETGRRRQVITEAEFLARRESVERKMIVRQREDRIQIGVLEDGVLAEHFVSKTQQDSLIGNVYVGKVQNVLPSMEAAFVDIGRGRNAVLYAGEVNWDVAALEGQPRRIENALKAGDSVLVQVTKDPVGHKGARLTSQISLPGRYLVYVPGGSMTGISRKLPDVERQRLKKILKDHLPENAGVIVRTAAEGASEEELTNDINRLRAQWEGIEEQANSTKTLAPELLYSEPDLTIKVVRDVFNEDFTKLIVSGEHAWDTIEAYVMYVAPDLMGRLEKWESDEDIFADFRVDEQIAKALDRKVFLPSGGSLVIDRTEAMTVIDVNTGKFTGSGGNLEETVTKNNLEAAEEVVRQLRLRDIGGIIVIDFIDMVLESNRDLVLRRLVECLGRDRTKHQVAEVTSLGLVQMTRKRMGTGLLEVFGEECEHCAGAGVITHEEPVESRRTFNSAGEPHAKKFNEKPSRNSRRRRGGEKDEAKPVAKQEAAATGEKDEATRNALASIAAASHLEPHAENAVSIEGEQIPVLKTGTPVAADVSVTLEALEAALPGKDETEDEGGEGNRKPRRRSRSRGRNRSQAEAEQQGAKAEEAGQDIEAEQPAAVAVEDEPKQVEQPRKRSRRVSRPQGSGAASAQDQPVLTGLAMPASSAPAAAEATAPAAASAAASAVAPQSSTKPKRRSRRATSAQGDATAEVLVAEVSAATGSVVQMDASSSHNEKPAEPAGQPVMFGVGVPVRELK
ncbi:Rne/Rng family ribonuclease [Glutamicibacter halophytocola]|uniref:Rne/Rng family ribonuclease n=2 Tax=Glutamicibacter halophytocola TaxID=1933880 RepID=A0ABX5YE63_9MICC|nr:Rne/Rng family ribonuclease [Glutamicibacter halophytocola]NQD40964.1 Rne/Rng family ribonuclease [Glutamicibacter halophytocola]QDY67969.1 Rne/Rng family ribonuclease [Glutamicibacter halophytocola]